MKRLPYFIALAVTAIFIAQAGLSDAWADGTPTGKRQHKPFAITKELQAAMENASTVPELAGILVLCADACAPQSGITKSGDVTLKRGGAGTSAPARSGDITLKRGVVGATSPEGAEATAGKKPRSRMLTSVQGPYRCTGQSCSCTGPEACVDMVAESKVCKLGTVKCTARSCSCTKGGRGRR